MGYDILKARESGITDTQSAEFLANKYSYDIEKARKAGLSDTQISEFLTMSGNQKNEKQVPTVKNDWTPTEQLARGAVGVGENALSMLTGMVTGGVGGLTGLSVMPFVGPSEAVKTMENIKNYAYTPKTEMGQTIAKGIDWPVEQLRKMVKSEEDINMQRNPGSTFQAVMSGLSEAIPDLLMFAMEKPGVAQAINARKGISKPVISNSFDQILKDNPLLAPKEEVPIIKEPIGPDATMSPFVGDVKTKIKGGGKPKVEVVDPFGLNKEEPTLPSKVSKTSKVVKETPEDIVNKILEAKLGQPRVETPTASEPVISKVEKNNATLPKEEIIPSETPVPKGSIGKPFNQKAFIGSEQADNIYSMTTSMPKENGEVLPFTIKLDKPYYVDGLITPEIQQIAKGLKADGVISNSTGQVRPFSYLNSVKKFSEVVKETPKEVIKPSSVENPIPVVETASVPPTVDRPTLLSNGQVSKEYSKILSSSDYDYKIADKWLDSEGLNLYNKSQKVEGKAGNLEDLVKESGKLSPWEAIKNERGGVELQKINDSIMEALYKAGKFIPRLGTIGHEDLGPLQNALNRVLSPSYMSQVDPYSLRMTDYVINKLGLTQADIMNVIEHGSNSKLFDQVSSLTKSAGYVPEGKSMVELLKQDQRSIMGSKEVMVDSWRKEAPRKIYVAGLSYELEKAKLIQEKVHQMDQLYKGLSKDQEIVVGKLLGTYHDIDSKIPQPILEQYPKEVQVFNDLRNIIFEDLWNKADMVGTKAPKHINEYFPMYFEDLHKMTPEKRGQFIRAFATENHINYATAEKIIRGNIPVEGFFGPLSKSRALNIPAELQNTRVWDKSVVEWYIKGAARYIGLKKFLPIADRGLEALAPDVGLPTNNIHSAMKNYVDVTRGIPVGHDMELGPWAREAARMEGFRQSVTKMGGNVAFGLTNLTQYPLNSGIRILSNTRPGDGLWNFTRGIGKVFTEEGRKIAHETGVNTDMGKGELSISDLHGNLKKVAEVLNIFSEVTERFNKTAEVNRVWPDLIKEGTAKGLTGQALQDYALSEARYSVAKTQFFSGKADRPIAFQGPVGSTVGKFKLFTVKQLEFISNLRGSEIATFIGMNHMFGGPNALGLDILKNELQDSQYKDSEAVKAFVKYMDYGNKFSVSGVTGFDMTKKIGIGMFPGLDQPSRFYEGVIQFIDPVTRRDYANFFKDINEGRVASSMEELVKGVANGQLSMEDVNNVANATAKMKGDFLGVPIGVKRLAKWQTERVTGMSEDRFGGRIGPPEGVRTLIGYPSNAISDVRNDITRVQDAQKQAGEEKQIIEAEFISAARSQDDKKMKRVMGQLSSWNEKWPSQGVSPIWPETLVQNHLTKSQELWWRQGQNMWGRARLMELQNRRGGK